MNLDLSSISVSLSIIGVFISAVLALIAMGWVGASYLNKKFSESRHLIYEKIDELEKVIISKLEYHERHDDERFQEVRRNSDLRFQEVKNDIWDIRVRNAAQDGLKPLRSKDK